MLPDFIIIGAMKGGTTSLYHYLASHPDVVASSEKETDFFRSRKRASGGADAYRRLFAGHGSHAFEASPNYTKRHLFHGVPKHMHALVPDARLIYVLRDPVDRACSHYMHNVRKQRETRPFAQAIRGDGNNYIQTSRYDYQLRAFLKTTMKAGSCLSSRRICAMTHTAHSTPSAPFWAWIRTMIHAR